MTSRPLHILTSVFMLICAVIALGIAATMIEVWRSIPDSVVNPTRFFLWVILMSLVCLLFSVLGVMMAYKGPKEPVAAPEDPSVPHEESLNELRRVVSRETSVG